MAFALGACGLLVCLGDRAGCEGTHHGVGDGDVGAQVALGSGRANVIRSLALAHIYLPPSFSHAWIWWSMSSSGGL